MTSTLTIPTQLHVGYQTRSDTYTGQLAFVIYSDHKGERRRVNSWEGWRSKTIDPTDYTNDPIEGFVLNKGVGGARASYGWNARNEYVRVYDPRGFEIEISVANLLFILEHNNSIRGKGLEGKFVYAWRGASLMLLPVDCVEYQQSIEYMSNLTKRITKKDVVPGCLYLHKDMTQYMYLGKLHYRNHPTAFNVFDDVTQCPQQHVFLNTATDKYVAFKGFTNLTTRITTDVSADFGVRLIAYNNSNHGTTLKDVKLVVSNTPITSIESSEGGRNFVYNNYVVIRCAHNVGVGYIYRGSWGYHSDSYISGMYTNLLNHVGRRMNATGFTIDGANCIENISIMGDALPLTVRMSDIPKMIADGHIILSLLQYKFPDGTTQDLTR